jgi:hypothetical protein
MNTNFYFTLVLLLGLTASSSFGQRDSSVSLVNKAAAVLLLDEGDRLFDEGQVRAAMVKYNDAIAKNPFSAKSHYGLANCQYKILNFGFAEKSAATAYDLDSTFADAAFLLALSKHRLSKFDEAEKYYKRAEMLYKNGTIKELNIPFLIECLRFAQKIEKEGPKFTRKPMVGANSDFMDYSPLLYAGGKRLFFVSRRNNTTGGMRNPADQIYFEDIYHAVWNEKTAEWDSITNKIGRLNTAGFDAVSHISADETVLFLTVNNTMVPKVKRKNRTKSSDIATVKLGKNGIWPAPKVIQGAVNTDFYEGSPSLTADMKTMYFAAQRRTSDGQGTEIMMSQAAGKNWSKAEVVAGGVNNKGRQTTPFITPDGNYLFFSSDSHLGLGGYDIFVAKRQGNNWSKPINLGAGINSVNDDTHFKYYPQWKMAVLASIEIIENKATYNMYTVDMSNFDLDAFKFEW